MPTATPHTIDAQLYRAKRQGKNQVCVCGRKLDPDGADKPEGF